MMQDCWLVWFWPPIRLASIAAGKSESKRYLKHGGAEVTEFFVAACTLRERTSPG